MRFDDRRPAARPEVGVLMPALYDGDGHPLGPKERPFTAEQATPVTRREGALLLSANAGSGKTTVLAERFARAVLEDGLSPGRLLAITFTDKAAGELRSRLRTRLVELGAREAAREMDAAWVSTIHGFCARVLRSNAVAAGLDPGFTVLDDPTARAIRTRAWDEALAAFLAHADAAPRLELVAAYGPDPLADAIDQVHGELRSRGHTSPQLPPPHVARDPAQAFADLAHAQQVLAAELAASPRTGATLDKGREVVTAAGVCLQSGDHAGLGGLKLSRGVAELKTEAADAFREALATATAAVLDERATADWALLDELLQHYAAAYAQGKRARSALDYDDLELGVCDLFTRDPGLAAHYADRFDRIMVDEFQDTNPLQLQIIDALDRESVFAVGDELQSIYGFRHADVGVFRDRREAHARAGRAAELQVNWRSRPELLHTINAWLGPMHPRYSKLVPGRSDAPDADPRTELLIVDQAWDDESLDEVLAEEVGAGMPAGKLSRQAEARAIARRVREVIEEDERAPGDVAVLLRAATDLQLFERALELEGLPTLASGGRGFWGRQQVHDLTSYLAVLVNPRDELALYSVLASPLVGLSSDALAALSHERGPILEAAHALGPGDAAKLRAFHGRLLDERPRAARFGLDELIARAVAHSGYDLHVLRLAGGRRRLANIHKLERLAAAFEAQHGRDLRGFIDHARAELDADAREPEAPIDPGDRSAVALMTIHAAKGLEFPVVVVADLGRLRTARTPRIICAEDGRTGLRIIRAGEDNLEALDFSDLKTEALAREQEEERRILHVAVTRAEERLILSAAVRLGEEREWPRPSATAPAIAEIGPLLDEQLPQRLAETAVIDYDETRDGERLRLRVTRVAPQDAPDRLGIDAGAGQLSFALDGGAPPTVPRAARTQPEPVSIDVPETVVPARIPASISYSQLSAHDRCGYRHYLERVLRLPRSDDEEMAITEVVVEDALNPLIRGSILHELLEELDLADPQLPTDEDLDLRAEREGAELSAADREDLRTLVQTFLDSPFFARLRAASDVRREDTFTFALGPTMVNGAVDVRAREEATALIVDYKTDRLRPDTVVEEYVLKGYGAQRLIYALAELKAGAPAVEVVHLFLERPDQPAIARFTSAQLPELEAELLQRAGALLDGRFPIAPEPYVQLCHGCPGRGTLCVHPLELTQRVEAPPPSVSPAAG